MKGRGRRGWIKHLVGSFVLLVLSEKPCHGYDLAKKLSEIGFDFSDVAEMGALYRLLNWFESCGLVKSQWNFPDAGPAKKVYSITPLGMSYLQELAKTLEREKALLDAFFEEYRKIFPNLT